MDFGKKISAVKKERRITGREADEKKTAGHREQELDFGKARKAHTAEEPVEEGTGENTDYSPDTLFWNRKKLRKRMKWKAQK